MDDVKKLVTHMSKSQQDFNIVANPYKLLGWHCNIKFLNIANVASKNIIY